MRALIAALILLLVPQASANAQTTRRGDWNSRGFVAVNGDYQAGGSSFADTLTRTVFVESQTISPVYDLPGLAGVDTALGMRVWRGLAVGVAIGAVTRSSSSAVAASLPHPFFFNRPRQIEGAAGTDHREVSAHIDATWVAPVGRRWFVSVSGGPSIIYITQGLVTDISYTDTYPYDAPAFASASVQTQSHSAFGANAGVDVTRMLSRRVGIGGHARFSHATATFQVPNGQAVQVDGGGLQFGGGLRVQF